MKKFLEKGTGGIVVIVLVFGGLFAYLKYFRGDDNKDNSDGADSSETVSPSLSLISDFGVDLTAELQKLKNLNTIDGGSVFNREDFKSLKDTQLQILERPVGRSNPFSSI